MWRKGLPIEACSLCPSHASVIFQPFSFHSPDRPAKPFRMSQDSQDFLALGLFSFIIRWVTQYTAHGEAFLYHVLSRPPRREPGTWLPSICALPPYNKLTLYKASWGLFFLLYDPLYSPSTGAPHHSRGCIGTCTGAHAVGLCPWLLSLLDPGGLFTTRYSGLWLGQPDCMIHEVCPAHEGQIQLNGYLVFLGWSFCLSQSPVTHQEMFSKEHIIQCSW